MHNFIERGLYAVLPSASIFLLHLNSTNTFAFMQLPDLFKVVFDNEQDFNFFLKNKSLDFVEQLPQDVYDVCVANIIE